LLEVAHPLTASLHMPSGQHQIAAEAARTAGPLKSAAAPINQSREAHRSAWLERRRGL
jgi:hypothetical protein